MRTSENMTEQTALITGITGQGGAFLLEYLLGKGYVVHGVQAWTTGTSSLFCKREGFRVREFRE
jgi:GDP-D-mannose dehydratase